MTTETATSLRVFLRCTPLFGGLSDEEFAQVSSAVREVEIERGKVLFSRGDPAQLFYIVVEGWVKVFRTTVAGEEAVIGIFTRGQSFAEIAALARDVYPASAEAVTDVRLVAVPVERIVSAISRDPNVALTMIGSICRHMHLLVDEIEQAKGLSGIQRVAGFLVKQSPVEKGACAIRLPYEKTLIASKLGMKAESLSRVFQRLRGYGVTIHGDMAAIDDVEKLRDVIEDTPSAGAAGRR
jgi:CRP/FNR family transcriptional regulator, dissimilatory nitrate respiration regulator